MLVLLNRSDRASNGAVEGGGTIINIHSASVRDTTLVKLAEVIKLNICTNCRLSDEDVIYLSIHDC